MTGLQEYLLQYGDDTLLVYTGDDKTMINADIGTVEKNKIILIEKKCKLFNFGNFGIAVNMQINNSVFRKKKSILDYQLIKI